MAHVVVFDDDPSFGEATVDRLLRRGYEAVGRYTGKEALALLLSEEFDVVVTDVRMPGMTGLDLCTSIASQPPGSPGAGCHRLWQPGDGDSRYLFISTSRIHAGLARASAMSRPGSESKNKPLVLEAFDPLFHKPDYAAAERFWSPVYIQQSAYIEPGRPVQPDQASPRRRNMSRE